MEQKGTVTDMGMDMDMDMDMATQVIITAMNKNLNHFGIRKIGSKRNRNWAMI
jgi:hypothetical protein